MADLVLEDGTGVVGADSFGSVNECAEFATNYFGASLTHSTAQKEAALRRAFVYMSGLSWKAGLWPTFGGAIPAAVKRAQFVFARAEISSVGVLSPSVTPQPNKILTRAGDLGWTPNTSDSSVEESRPVITMAFDFLAPYLELNPARDKGDTLYIRSIGG